MSHAVFSVSVVDLDENTHGAMAAKFVVDAYNDSQQTNGQTLPTSPWESLKESYLQVLSISITAAHEDYIIQQAEIQAGVDQLNKRWVAGNEAERASALSQLPMPSGVVEILPHDGEPEEHSHE